jgi:glycosyltransferase involved in cell wall biosynthesis
MKDFLIIIPAYNEARSIDRVLKGIAQQKLNADILVVNDGSEDETELQVLQNPVFLITHPTNLGYGAALQTGFKFAIFKKYRFVIQFDADDQHHPQDLRGIMDGLNQGNADVVIGSRYLGDPSYNPGRLKKTAVTLFKALIHRFTKVHITDPTSGLRGLSEKVFGYYAVSNRFPADFPDADILIQMILNQFRVREVPARSRLRMQGVSMHTGIKPVYYLLKILLSILTVLLRHRITKRGMQS